MCGRIKGSKLCCKPNHLCQVRFCERLAVRLKNLNIMKDYREFVRKENDVTV